MTERKTDTNKKEPVVKTFTVPSGLYEQKEKITITTNTPPQQTKTSKLSKKEIINQAFKFHSQGKILEAAKYYQYFINQGFKDHLVFSNYGNILKDLGKLKEAEISTRKAIELSPNFAGSHFNLGIILKDLRKLNDAALSFRKAIELKPDYAEAYSNLGTILLGLGKSKDAELSYRKAIELKPNYAQAIYNLGDMLYELGDLKEAEFFTRKSIRIKPDLIEAYINLGLI